MKKIFSILAIATATLFAVSCSSEYDDTAVWDELGKHNERISKLETLCGQMNTNISSLQAIVTALQNNDFVTGVAPITQNGVEIGYTISFSKSGSITIYHGKDGRDGVNGTDGKDGINGSDGVNGTNGIDGTTPIIGVKQDTDGVYYWTVNGEWLLDDVGNKIKAVGTDGQDGTNGADGADGKDGVDGTNGTDGKDGVNGTNGTDGITPQLKIEDDYWYISYDNGATWIQLGKATGEDGQIANNGDSQFVNIDTSNVNYVIFTLVDGTVIKLPTWEFVQSQNVFSIVFDNTDFVIGAVEDLAIPFKLTGTVGVTEIDAIAMYRDDDQSARIEMLDETNGVLYISRILWGDDFNVLVIASNNGRTIHKLVTIRSGELYTYDYFEISGLGGTIEIPITTNYDYEVVIPEEYLSWMSCVNIETRSELRDEVIVMSISQNMEEYDRYGEIELKDKLFGSLLARIYVYQMPVQLRLSADKTSFNADGVDFVQLDVEESGWTITDGVEFYNADNERVEIDNFQFKATTAGSYSLYAKCGDVISNTIHILAKNENTPEYISTMSETGSDDILCTVLGLDGSILYYHQDKSRPGVVNKISKFNNISREIEFVVNLDEDGKVANILTPEQTIVLGNYHDNLVDAMIFAQNGERVIIKDINYTSVATLMTRTPTGIEIANLVVSGVATGLEFAAIASVGVAAAGPVAVTTATIGAALLLYDAATTFDLIEEGSTGVNLATHLVGHYGNLAGLATNFPTNRLEVLAALVSQAADVIGLLEVFENNSESEIIVGNGTLEPNGCLSATLTWSGPADIDLHCVDPSGCHVYYSNKISPIGGYLDNDNTTANGPETIYYSNPQYGSYSFYIHYYAENNGVSSVNYTVKINRFGEIAEYSGTISGQGAQIHIETLLIGGVTNTRTLELQNNYVIDWNNLPRK